jgi:mono/diheme cytochrome c family protein
MALRFQICATSSKAISNGLFGGKILQNRNCIFLVSIALIFSATVFYIPSFAQETTFHNAPSSATTRKNPYTGASAAAAGGKVYAQNCAQCHGRNREGMGPAPALDSAQVQDAKPGELFWFITNGKPTSGMPAWKGLPELQRWQIVTFLQSKAAPAK